MKICHFITGVDRFGGGTSTYEQILLNEMAKNTSVSLITFKTKNPLPFDQKVRIYLANYSFLSFHFYSREINKIFNRIGCDLFHGNGIWEFPIHQMANTARSQKIPYIISPHGMLEPWAMNEGKWKKKLSLWCYQYKDIMESICIHATSDMEAKNLRKLGFKNPIAVIPNGVDISEFSIAKKKNPFSKKTILFLSRIHPKKGIELLIEAWSRIEDSLRKGWQIKIAGNGNEKYVNKLIEQIIRKELENEIEVIGPKFGKDKMTVYHQADLFVLPSHSENFGMVVTEALACGVPVITTKGAPWEVLNKYNAGWWIDIGVEPLVGAISKAMKLTDTARIEMGKNGRRLVEQYYSIEVVTNKMIQLYNWILNDGDKSDFIFTS